MWTCEAPVLLDLDRTSGGAESLGTGHAMAPTLFFDTSGAETVGPVLSTFQFDTGLRAVHLVQCVGPALLPGRPAPLSA